MDKSLIGHPMIYLSVNVFNSGKLPSLILVVNKSEFTLGLSFHLSPGNIILPSTLYIYDVFVDGSVYIAFGTDINPCASTLVINLHITM